MNSSPCTSISDSTHPHSVDAVGDVAFVVQDDNNFNPPKNSRGTDSPDGTPRPHILPPFKTHSILNCPASKKDAKSPKKRVSFDRVDLYHFDRMQGFTCVPSQGGSTLGMASEHWVKERVPVIEHQMRRKHQRYSALLRFCLEGKLLLSLQQFRILESRVKQQQEELLKSSGDTGECSSSSSLKRPLGPDECPSDEDLSFLDNLEEYYFLQPLPVKRRRIMLRKAGKITGIFSYTAIFNIILRKNNLHAFLLVTAFYFLSLFTYLKNE